MIRRAAPVTALAAVALALGGCGGDEEEEEGDSTPATMVPADARVYVEAQVRPEGEERAAIEAPLAALMDTDDPGAEIVKELDRMGATADPPFSYAEDVEPWLGERVALFFTEFSFSERTDPAFGEDLQGAFVVEASDPDEARAAIERTVDDDEAEEASHEGVDYLVTGDTAVGVVGDAVVFGSAEGFDAAVDVAAGADALADDPEFAESVGEEPGAASAYVDVPALLEDAEAAGELPPATRKGLDLMFAGALDAPMTLLLEPDTTGIGAELSYGESDVPALLGRDDVALLRELPEDTWFAAGIDDVGQALLSYIPQGEELGLSGERLAEVERVFERHLGVSPEELERLLGRGVLFAHGEGFGAGGGLVVDVSNPVVSFDVMESIHRALRADGAAVGKLRQSRLRGTAFALALPGVPANINFVQHGDLVVIVYGDPAIEAGLGRGPGNIEANEKFGEAESKLGSEFDLNLFLDFDSLVDLLEIPAQGDPSLDSFRTALASLDFLAIGSRVEDDRETRQFYLGISGISTEPTA